MKDNRKRNLKDNFFNAAQNEELYNVGRRLYQARKEKRLTQKAVAEQLDISNSLISNHENGMKFTVSILNKYAKLYGKPVEFFFIEDIALENSLQPQINEQEVMRRILPTILPWFRKKSFRYLRYLDIGERELARWKSFSKKEENSSNFSEEGENDSDFVEEGENSSNFDENEESDSNFVEKEETDNNIHSIRFVQYQKIAADLNISLYELLFDK